MNETTLHEAKLKLLQRSALSRPEMDLRLREALDPEYWRRFCPDLSVGDGAGLTESSPLPPQETERRVEGLSQDGYFQTGPVLDPTAISRMRGLVERLREAGWPPVFSYIYDEFWAAVRVPSLRRLISGFLGEGYKQNSLIWTYFVASVKGAAGWPPHTDSGDHSARLTVWVPLSEATLDNGCMYVIPSSRVPADLPPLSGMETVTRVQLGQLLQAARALPSLPGAFMGWRHDVTHWGSVASGQGAPRISIAVEFVAPGTASRRDEEPLFDALECPPFSERLRAIGKGLQQYAKFEPLMARYQELGALLSAGQLPNV